MRLSGPEATRIAAELVRTKRPLQSAHARYGLVLDGDGQRIDDAVVTLFPSPNSYTGEDVVEISTHGSPVVLTWLLRAAAASGARTARPGEFTERAFLHGRIDLTAAEAVRDLIEAQTLAQVKLAAEQAGGALAALVRPAKQQLIELIAALEAGIDFAEDDLETLPFGKIRERIEAVEAPLQALLSTFQYGRILREGLRLAIVGPPNAGKSSLFNRLVERERAIVTSIPGTTRDVIAEQISLSGIPVELLDTAGLRETSDPIEEIGIRRTHEAVAEADLILYVTDASDPGQKSSTVSLGTRLQGLPMITIRNKIDLVPAQSRAGVTQPKDAAVPTSAQDDYGVSPALDDDGVRPALDRACVTPPKNAAVPTLARDDDGVSPAQDVCGFSPARDIDGVMMTRDVDGPSVATSALTGEGMAELRAAILARVGGDGEGAAALTANRAVLSNVRQRDALDLAASGLGRAALAATASTPHEMLLLELYDALRALDELTGQTTSDDVLHLIFSTFCIGK